MAIKLQTYLFSDFFDLHKLNGELGLFLAFFLLEQLHHLLKFTIGFDIHCLTGSLTEEE